MKKTKNKKDTVSKVVDDLDAIIDWANQMSHSFIMGSLEKQRFFSNISHELHQISERLDEYNLNNSK